MLQRAVYDALFVGLQSGFLLCLGIVMILAGRSREKYTRRIHLLTGLLCCFLVIEFLAPSVFVKETMDIYYEGISNAHTAKFSSIVVQAEAILSYPLLAMVLFSLFQAFKQIPFRMILFPLAIPAALLVWTIVSFDPELQTLACNIFWGIYVTSMIVSFLHGIKGYTIYCKDNYSDTTGLSLKWLAGMPLLLIPVIVFDRYVYSVHSDNLIMAIVSEISILPPIVYLVWFAHRQTPADECSGGRNNHDTGDFDSGSQQLSADMIEKLSLLLEAECVQSEAFLDPQLTRNRLSAALGTNSTYLSRYFAQNGTNFNEYINGLRLDYACRLIKDSNERNTALSKIALGSGFANYRTFSRLFVSRFGVSPNDWRNGNIQKNV